ncbi:hypothetical protein PHLGIDRAFT_359360 [Phlebiopsis gigantea 11061_1 CR5-6]|uniref:Uncharacterized protein n=1 Tax=Phlebiopsis gigantea (strain 11061_1 CR5-6) TaxID=745531 RepID=A0A0C3RYR7_PHLG1|nr:hypothetical protein PHLGIDRAFT_359360 [Phlebiopsis gigantea 11061_1 CR5-6]
MRNHSLPSSTRKRFDACWFPLKRAGRSRVLVLRTTKRSAYGRGSSPDRRPTPAPRKGGNYAPELTNRHPVTYMYPAAHRHSATYRDCRTQRPARHFFHPMTPEGVLRVPNQRPSWSSVDYLCGPRRAARRTWRARSANVLAAASVAPVGLHIRVSRSTACVEGAVEAHCSMAPDSRARRRASGR